MNYSLSAARTTAIATQIMGTGSRATASATFAFAGAKKGQLSQTVTQVTIQERDTFITRHDGGLQEIYSS